jgi:hypothetical protein
MAERSVRKWSSPRMRWQRGQGLAVKLAGLLIITQGPEHKAEQTAGGQREEVVLAEDAVAAGEGLALKLPGLLIVP